MRILKIIIAENKFGLVITMSEQQSVADQGEPEVNQEMNDE